VILVIWPRVSCNRVLGYAILDQHT
jgi:hypothetical protein